MTASFSSGNLVGNYTKKVTVTTNDPKHSKEVLTCKGSVLVPFKASPRNANFQAIQDYTTPLPRTVTIKRGDGGPLQIEIVRAGKQGITAELREVKPGEHYELIVALSPPQKPGRLRSWIRVKTGVKELPETTIPVYADIPASWAEGLAAR